MVVLLTVTLKPAIKHSKVTFTIHNVHTTLQCFRFNLMAVVPDRRIALTQKLQALELNQKRVKEAISKIGKHLRHLLSKGREFNGKLAFIFILCFNGLHLAL